MPIMRPGYTARMESERIVSFRARTVLTTAAVLLALAVVILVVWEARRAITWGLISLFLALALKPAVEALQRRGPGRRRAPVAAIYIAPLGGLARLPPPPAPPPLPPGRGPPHPPPR